MLLLDVGREFATIDAAALGLLEATDALGVLETANAGLVDGEAAVHAVTATTKAAPAEIKPSRLVLALRPTTRAAYSRLGL
jgi:hypothetical protein